MFGWIELILTAIIFSIMGYYLGKSVGWNVGWRDCEKLHNDKPYSQPEERE